MFTRTLIRTVFGTALAGLATCVSAGTISDDYSAPAANLNVEGSAAVSGGVLQLTDAGSQEGGAFYDPLDTGPTQAFEATFDFQMGGGSSPGADGITFYFGTPDGSPTAGIVGDNGPANGIAVGFDTFLNAGDDADDNHISLFVNESEVDVFTAAELGSFDLNDNLVHSARVVMSAIGELGVFVTRNGGSEMQVLSHTIGGFAPLVGHQFGFYGRTGGNFDFQSIDNFNAQTEVPAPAVVALFLLAGLGLRLRGMRGGAKLASGLGCFPAGIGSRRRLGIHCRKSHSIAVALALMLVAPFASAAQIVGVTIEDVSSEFSQRLAVHTIDSSGFNAGAGTHGNTSNNAMWQANFGADPHVTAGDGLIGHITFDLGDVYDVSSFHIWNFYEGNNAAGTFAGTGPVNILVSATSTLSGLTATGAFSTLATNALVAANHLLAPNDTGTQYNESFSARYVRIEQVGRIDDQFTAVGAGLAEVRFDGVLASENVPGPAGAGLLGLTFAALTGRRRWRRRR